MNKGPLTQIRPPRPTRKFLRRFVKGSTAHRYLKIVALAVSCSVLVAVIALEISASPNAITAKSNLRQPLGFGRYQREPTGSTTTASTATTTTSATSVATSGGDVGIPGASTNTSTPISTGPASATSGSSHTSLKTQMITFTSTPPTNPTVGGTYSVSATGGGSGNPVTFSIASGACSISGATVSFTVVGMCVVDADQVGNSKFNAASRVQQEIAVTAGQINSAPGPASGLSLVFDGTFNGTGLDTSMWQTCYPFGCTNFGNPQEKEWYAASQDQVSGSALHLVETRTPAQGTTESGAPETYSYRSGMVTTFSSFNFTYGYLQIVARIPGGTGTWPALWLLPVNRAWPPEIDVMENWGSTNAIQSTVYWGTPSDPHQAHQEVTSNNNLTTGWHTYGLRWEPGSLTWYLDGQVVNTYTGSKVPSQAMYFVANLAIDGSAASNSSFDIRSVQVYQ